MYSTRVQGPLPPAEGWETNAGKDPPPGEVAHHTSLRALAAVCGAAAVLEALGPAEEELR